MYLSLFNPIKYFKKPVGRTERQREVLQLLFFLRNLSSYYGVSPGKAVYLGGKTIMKTTPVKQKMVI